ncbi:hypothetical protein F2P81_016176 [Scophthalmus maximus]|uniref:Uncharacterized protein n=1 Tax=Scophthalmus maximus TaxID=52904 RepID=A0A6A4SKG2_SCOMX|nr:hypothetical protein F2P81_016176 [Scophthalmus maximus]
MYRPGRRLCVIEAHWRCRELSTLNLNYLHTGPTDCGRRDAVNLTQLSPLLLFCPRFGYRLQPASGPACGQIRADCTMGRCCTKCINETRTHTLNQQPRATLAVQSIQDLLGGGKKKLFAVDSHSLLVYSDFSVKVKRTSVWICVYMRRASV